MTRYEKDEQIKCTNKHIFLKVIITTSVNDTRDANVAHVK